MSDKALAPCYFAESLGRDDDDYEGLDGSTECKPVTKADYCHGCKQVVCRNHDVNMTLTEQHLPEEHLKSEDLSDADTPPDDYEGG